MLLSCLCPQAGVLRAFCSPGYADTYADVVMEPRLLLLFTYALLPALLIPSNGAEA